MLELEKRKLHRPHGFLWLFTFWVFLTFPTNFLPKDSNWFVSPKDNLNLSHVTWFSSNVLLKFVKAESDNRMDFDAFSICHWWKGNESKYFRHFIFIFCFLMDLFQCFIQRYWIFPMIFIIHYFSFIFKTLKFLAFLSFRLTFKLEIVLTLDLLFIRFAKLLFQSAINNLFGLAILKIKWRL